MFLSLEKILLHLGILLCEENEVATEDDNNIDL